MTKKAKTTITYRDKDGAEHSDRIAMMRANKEIAQRGAVAVAIRVVGAPDKPTAGAIKAAADKAQAKSKEKTAPKAKTPRAPQPRPADWPERFTTHSGEVVELPGNFHSRKLVPDEAVKALHLAIVGRPVPNASYRHTIKMRLQRVIRGELQPGARQAKAASMKVLLRTDCLDDELLAKLDALAAQTKTDRAGCACSIFVAALAKVKLAK